MRSYLRWSSPGSSQNRHVQLTDGIYHHEAEAYPPVIWATRQPDDFQVNLTPQWRHYLLTESSTLATRACHSSDNNIVRSLIVKELPRRPKKSFANWWRDIPSPPKWVPHIKNSQFSMVSVESVTDLCKEGDETTRYDKRSFDRVLGPFKYESMSSEVYVYQKYVRAERENIPPTIFSLCPIFQIEISQIYGMLHSARCHISIRNVRHLKRASKGKHLTQIGHHHNHTFWSQMQEADGAVWGLPRLHRHVLALRSEQELDILNEGTFEFEIEKSDCPYTWWLSHVINTAFPRGQEIWKLCVTQNTLEWVGSVYEGFLGGEGIDALGSSTEALDGTTFTIASFDLEMSERLVDFLDMHNGNCQEEGKKGRTLGDTWPINYIYELTKATRSSRSSGTCHVNYLVDVSPAIRIRHTRWMRLT